MLLCTPALCCLTPGTAVGLFVSQQRFNTYGSQEKFAEYRLTAGLTAESGVCNLGGSAAPPNAQGRLTLLQMF